MAPAQWVKALATKTGDMNLTPGTYMVEEKNCPYESSDIYTHTHTYNK